MIKTPLRFTALTALFVAVFALLLAPAGFAAGETSGTVVATLKDDKTVSAQITLDQDYVGSHPGAQIYLFAFEPWEPVSSLDSKKPVAFAPIKRQMTLEAPYIRDDGGTRKYCKFLAAQMNKDGTYEAITAAVYITDFGSTAENTAAYPLLYGKKGLRIQQMADAQTLGVAHTVINASIDEFIIPGHTDDAVSVEIGGVVVFFDGAKVDALDRRIKACTDAGIHVYLYILLGPRADRPDALSALWPQNAGSAAFYSPDTTTEDGARMVEAFLELLAERYTRDDRKYGFAGSFIIGYEVNERTLYNDSGDVAGDAYIWRYAALVRMADVALRSHYKNGRVYVSVGNRWNAEGGEGSFTAREFLTSFAATARYGGDFAWGVSAACRPSDVSVTTVWDDPGATDGYDTPYLTPANLSVLTSFMKTEGMLYNGAPRRIVINEFGVAADTSDALAAKQQAASYAYMFYKVMEEDGIEALIYRRQTDGTGAAEGLRRDDGTEKDIYAVFRDIDITEPSDMVTKVLKALGADLWSGDVGSNLRYSPGRKLIKGYPLAGASAPDSKGEAVFDFADGETHGFFAAEGGAFALCRPTANEKNESVTALYVSLDATSRDWMGAGVDLASYPDALKKAKYLRVTVFPELAGAENVSVMIRLFGKSAEMPVAFEGTAKVSAGKWSELCFDVGEFTGLIDTPVSARVWVKSDAQAEGDWGLYVGSLSVVREGGMPMIAKVILISLAVLALLAGGAAVAYVLWRKNEEKHRRLAGLPITADPLMPDFIGRRAMRNAAANRAASGARGNINRRPAAPRVNTRNVPRQSTQNMPCQSTQTVPRQATQNTPRQSTQNVPRQATQNVPRQSTQNVPRQATQNVTRQSTQSMPRQATQNVPRQATQNVPRQATQNVPRQATQNVPRQNGANAQSDSRRMFDFESDSGENIR